MDAPRSKSKKFEKNPKNSFLDFSKNMLISTRAIDEILSNTNKEKKNAIGKKILKITEKPLKLTENANILMSSSDSQENDESDEDSQYSSDLSY